MNQQSKKEPKKLKPKCHYCNKKLKMMSFTCKCGLNFCIAHQYPHTHNCSYNYKTEKCKIIEINNPKLISKMIKI